MEFSSKEERRVGMQFGQRRRASGEATDDAVNLLELSEKSVIVDGKLGDHESGEHKGYLSELGDRAGSLLETISESSEG